MMPARSIFVVERIDRQPFALPLRQANENKSGLDLRVLGVGFPTMEGADEFLHIVGDHQHFIIQPLVEGPIAPIFNPNPQQAN